MRLCVVTRQRLPRRQLWRVVRGRDRLVSLDVGQGRSAYVSRQVTAVRAARKKDRLGKALKCQVGKGIYDELETRALRLEKEIHSGGTL